MLIEEHKKWAGRSRKINFEEIMSDLSESEPSRFLNRKIQTYIASEFWPPTYSDTFDQVEGDGIDNSFTSSVEAVKFYILLGAPNFLETIVLRLGNPVVAEFKVRDETHTVRARTAAMAMTMAYLTHQRLRQDRSSGVQ